VRSWGLLVATAALTVLCVAACSPSRAVPGPGSQPRPTMATTAPGTTPAEPPVQPAFRASVTALNASWRWRLRYTWHPDCPQPLSGLALAFETIKVNYAGYWAAEEGRRVML